MIIPARWYAGGKGLDGFRDAMLNDNHIRVMHDFVNASDCFPSVEIKGGVCYFLWDRDNDGDCKIFTHEGNKITSELERPLLEKNCDVFIRYNEAIEILHKVKAHNEVSFSTIVRPAMTFGFRTFFKDFDRDTYKTGYIKVYANRSQGFVKKEKVLRSMEWIDKWKVVVPEAIGIGNMKVDCLKPIISEPYSINTETYIMNGPYKSKLEAENVVSYINTKFFHFLLGLKKITQHTTQSVYQFIPMQDFSKSWTDEELYKKYDFNDDEISFVNSMVRPMSNENGGESNG
jgi:site-specific DNA-methyltransferase (adenine-specific)